MNCNTFRSPLMMTIQVCNLLPQLAFVLNDKTHCLPGYFYSSPHCSNHVRKRWYFMPVVYSTRNHSKTTPIWFPQARWLTNFLFHVDPENLAVIQAQVAHTKYITMPHWFKYLSNSTAVINTNPLFFSQYLINIAGEIYLFPFYHYSSPLFRVWHVLVVPKSALLYHQTTLGLFLVFLWAQLGSSGSRWIKDKNYF